MLTIGGLICSERERQKLQAINWSGLGFVRTKLSSEPFRIEVPVLTRKERLYIDSHMPCEDGWVPDFEIEPEVIRLYRTVYRYCPLYAELIL
jgi:hypothetical protein